MNCSVIARWPNLVQLVVARDFFRAADEGYGLSQPSEAPDRGRFCDQAARQQRRVCRVLRDVKRLVHERDGAAVLLVLAQGTRQVNLEIGKCRIRPKIAVLRDRGLE
jgi:hypothetical protein